MSQAPTQNPPAKPWWNSAGAMGAIGGLLLVLLGVVFYAGGKSSQRAIDGPRPAVATGPAATTAAAPAAAAAASPAPKEPAVRDIRRPVASAPELSVTPPPRQVVQETFRPPPVEVASGPRKPVTLNILEAAGQQPRQAPVATPPPARSGADGPKPVQPERRAVRRYSEAFLPTGTLLRCDLAFAVSSDSQENPIIGIVRENVYSPSGRLVVPKNTRVHGTAGGISGIKEAAKLRTGSRWTLVFPTFDDVPAGAELILRAIALNRSENPAIRGSWAISDGDAGLRGYSLDDPSADRVRQFLTAFISAGAAGLQTSTTQATAFGTNSSVEATPRNAALGATSAVLAQEVARLQRRIEREGNYILVPGGTPFYLYLQGTVDLRDARIGDSSAFLAGPASDYDTRVREEEPGRPAGLREEDGQRQPVPVPQAYGRGVYQRTRPEPDPFSNPAPPR